MNTANLQLRGLVMALAAIVEVMKRNGLMTADELDEALSTAEKHVIGQDDLNELTESNLDAIYFPIRALRWASESGNSLSFDTIAATVGETKQSPGEQEEP
jgi:hypothetical protein